MTLYAASRVFLVIGLLGSLLPAPTAGAPSSVGPSGASGKRWVSFDLASSDPTGEIQVGQPLELSIAIGGVTQGSAPLVAICESVWFERQIVTLEPDPVSMVMKATAALEPIPHGKLSVIPKVARVQVTFARQKEKFERVMTRIVYVTLGAQSPQSDIKEPVLPASEELVSDGGGPTQEEVQPDVEPIAAGHVKEEDLLPLPTPGQGRAYWQQISSLVSRSWSRTARRVRHSPTSETVRVRFRLYPTGRAQLIEIEKGSGAREIDEAGIFAVVHAQPFPPFPDDVGTEPVDVHVRMRTGARPGSQDSRSVTHSQGTSPNSGTVNPKP